MASGKQFVWILLLLGNCFPGHNKTQPHQEFIPISNIQDSLDLSQIVIIRKDGYREIFSTGPEAMRYIFYRSGCSDGTPLSGLLSHEWNQNTLSARWTGLCKSMKTDSIYFRLLNTENPAILKQFGTITSQYLQLAEERKDPMYYFKAIENEPALPDARYHLFFYELENQNCLKALRHFQIFLRLSPKFSGKPEMEKSFRNACKNTEKELL